MAGYVSSITCPYCGRTVDDPDDVRQGYCGWCHPFHAALAADWARVPAMTPMEAFELGIRHGRMILERHAERERS